MEEVVEDKDFHGCYLLRNTDGSYTRTYIGYTVNPLRRIKQHNLGCQKGGAKSTSNKGHWDMILIVYGFMSNVAALQFEWAWQNPDRSRKLRGCAVSRKNGENTVAYKLRVMSTMLRTRPWSLLPLTIRWLSQEFVQPLPEASLLPAHFEFLVGALDVKRSKSKKSTQLTELKSCYFCDGTLERMNDNFCVCPASESCMFQSHLTCWAVLSCVEGELIPLTAACPVCETTVLWGDVVRKKNSCSSDLRVLAQLDKSAGNLNETLGDLLLLLEDD